MKVRLQSALYWGILLIFGNSMFLRGESIDAPVEFQFKEVDFCQQQDQLTEKVSKVEISIFNISNEYDAIEKVSLSCGCSSAKIDKSTIPPSGFSNIIVEIDNSSALAFRVERGVITWKSGRITQFAIAKKNNFGAFLSENSVTLNSTSESSKSILMYFDDVTFAHVQNNGSINIDAISTTGAVRVAIQKADNIKNCLILTVTAADQVLTADILRIAFPGSPNARIGFILCKLNHIKHENN